MAHAEDALSAAEARRVALVAQGLLGPRLSGGPAAVLERVRGVQIDTISVLARSHELVAYARLGPVARRSIEAAYWGPRSRTFEYWSHAACILPLGEWPAYGFQRRRRIERGRRWHHLADADESCRYVLARLAAEGPLTATELGGAKKGGVWWDWSEVKIAAEWLLDVGEVVCRERRGFQRVYDLAERAVPEELRTAAWSDDDCRRHLIGRAAAALGVATAADLAAYVGVLGRDVQRLVDDCGLRKVAVEGWRQPAYGPPEAFEVLGRRLARRATLLSPFDSLIWDRGRTERLFGLSLRLEAYTPRAKRAFGYFAMPVLAGDRLVGLVDPGREDTTLVARHVRVDRPAELDAVARALAGAASWVGADQVVVERVSPSEHAGALRALVGARC